MTAERYAHAIEVRFRDLDARDHVNHAVYATYLEQAKAGFFAEHLGIDLSAETTVVRTLEIDYRASITLGEHVEVALEFVDVGTTSFTIEYEITVEGETVASARTVSVVLDAEGEPRPIPDQWRDGIERSRTG